jgi:hypothetical protein
MTITRNEFRVYLRRKDEMIKRKIVEEVIGKSFADHLDTPIFHVVDHFSFTRREMVEELGCANFIAAARLAKVLKRLGVESAAQLHQLDPFSLARARGIGESALFVATCILDASGYSVQRWWKWKQNDNVVKFSTFKRRALNRASKRKQIA